MFFLHKYRLALTILRDMRTNLHKFYLADPPSNSSNPLPSGYPDVDVLSLSLPKSNISGINDTTLTLISTYLSNALTSYTSTIFLESSVVGPGHDVETQSTTLHHFVDALHTAPTFLQWLPYLHCLPSRLLDSLLTRVYTSLTKSSSLLPATSAYASLHAKSIFLVRYYGLLLLLWTSPSTLKPQMFWDQTVKFTVAFVKSVAHSGRIGVQLDRLKEDLTSTILRAFDGLMLQVERRRDNTSWMDGTSFIAFCEYWTDFAKRVSIPHQYIAVC